MSRVPPKHRRAYQAIARRRGAELTDEDREVIEELYRRPRCSVCGRPTVAGQQGTHLSCSPDYRPPVWFSTTTTEERNTT